MWHRKNRVYYDNHHIIAQHPLDERVHWTNVEDNIIRIRRDTHDAIHKVFDTLPPASQIARLITMYKSALSDAFLQTMVEALESEIWNYYKKWVVSGELKAENQRIVDLINLL